MTQGRLRAAATRLGGRLAALPAAASAALFAALVALAGVASLPPLDRDEARFAQATAQMLETGDFVRIRFQDEARNKKPVGIHWLQAASVAAFSDVEARAIWAYRLPSILGAAVAAALTAAIGARLYDRQTGALAGCLLAATPLLAGEATIAKTDAVLLATVVAAMAALTAIVGRRMAGAPAPAALAYGFWAALGASVLVKGPIGPLIVGMALAVLVWRLPGAGLLKALRPLSGAALALAIVAPWGIAIGLATEGRFFVDAVGGDMLGKVGAAQERHGGPPGYHLALLPLLFLPGIALLPDGLRRAVGAARGRDWRATLLLAWAGPGWLVFELASTKLPHYPLPVYPALAVIAARAAFADGPVRIGAALFAAAGLAFAAALLALPMVFGAPGPHFVAAGACGAAVAATLVLAALFWRGRRRAAAWGATVQSAAVAWAVLQGVLPSLERLDISPALARAAAASGLHALRDGAPPTVLAGYSEPSAVFLLGTRTVLTDGAGAAAAARPGGLVAVEAREAEAFAAAATGLSLTPVGSVSGVNYSKGDEVNLTLYRVEDAPDPSARP